MEKETSAQLHISCPNCGSPEVVYSIEQEALYCSYCSYTRPLPKGKDQIIERPLAESYNKDEVPHGLNISTKVFHCGGCGSNISIPKEQASFVCPFCGSENVNEEAHADRIIQPAGILPFVVKKEEVKAKFKKWIGSGWFRPSNLSSIAKLDKIQGVYLPFWTYDAFTQSKWKAQAGYYYYVQQTYRDANGQTQTRTVQKVRWEPARGYHEHFFDDVLVCASHGVAQQMAEKVYPFQLHEVVNYDPHYLLGWEAEVYQKDIREGYKVADNIMDARIRQACIRQIPGDTYRNLRVKTEKGQHTFKHILLPVWVVGYRYKNKIFQYLVNGQTGREGGSKPWSVWKIALAVLLGVAVTAGLVYLNHLSETGQI